MKCPYCETEILKNDGFCENCYSYVGKVMDKEGNPIVVETKKVVQTKSSTTQKSRTSAATPVSKSAATTPVSKPTATTPMLPKPSAQKENSIINQNQIYFNFYLYLPLIVTIVLASCCFIGGIFLIVYDLAVIGICACWLGGGVVCAPTYFLMKITLSYKILHIYYLKELCKQNNK